MWEVDRWQAGNMGTKISAEITHVKVELWRWRREGGRWTGGKLVKVYQDLGRNHLLRCLQQFWAPNFNDPPRTPTTPPPNFNDPTPELQRPHPRTSTTPPNHCDPPELLQGPGNVKVELWRWRREGGRWRGRREEEGGGRRRRRRKEQKQTQDLHQGVRKTS